MSSSAFTCISCRVAFASADLQRAHYKSDWHRYNLKRKVAELPPVTAAEFKQRLLAQQSKAAEEERDTSTKCDVCGKHFGTENAYTNHLGSKKHKEAEAKMKAAASADNRDEVSVKNAKNKRDQAKVDSYEGQKMMREGAEKKKEQTIKDNTTSSSSSSSSSRKGNKPAAPPLVSVDVDEDMEGEEGEAEWEDVEGDEIPSTDCLFCSRSSSSMENNLQHMTVSHSFFLPNVEFVIDMEGLLSYLGVKVGCDFMCLWCNDKGKAFYSLDSVQRHMRDKGHSKLLYEGDAIYEYSDFYDFRKSYPDFDERNGGAVGGETRDGEEEEEDEEEMDLGRCEMKEEGFELTLPSGIKIGHRELTRYYKQNLPLERRVVKRNPALIGRLMTQYKALGWHGNKGEASTRMIRDLRYVQKFRTKQHVRLQVKANKFQTHFRCQNPI